MKRTFTTPCGCKKRRYRTQGIALSTALRATTKRGTPLRAYPCPRKPKGWHLTKRPSWGSR